MMLATGVLALVVLVGLIALWAWRYTKAGPNEVLIISGRKRKVIDPDGRKRVVGYRLVRGGAFVWPILERVQRLSLELLTIEIQTADAYTAQGVRMVVDAVAQVKVKGDEASIALAAEQFLSKSKDDIRRVALQVIEGHLRAVLGTMSVEDLYLRRAEFARQVREAARQDLERMGLDILSLTVRHIADEQGYLEAIGRPRIAQVRQQAAVAEAEADRVARIARLEAERAVEEARREREARRAEADMAYELHRHRVAQAVKREEMAVRRVEKELAIEIEEKEIERKRRELAATVELPAEAEKQRILALADAERYRLEAEAAGQAEGIRATGRAEAEAMRAKAGAWREYNEAAMAQMVVDILPALAKALAEPLSRAERIILIGDGHGGISRFTGDLAQAMAQLPALVEALTGVRLTSRLPQGLSQKAVERSD
ncbi:flotillin [Thermoflexus hugenholtzii JAD2]|uniref:Flotillin n=2 Tax=Thermoflexus TaxID=1495649 RepID=A0A212RKF4_9CHLR|nr:flotillin [Thermoflexus hugenholtzii JAD2]